MEVGSKVTKVKVGDHCAIGCMVDACLECEHCKRGDVKMENPTLIMA